MSSSATGVGMTICFLGAILLILTQKSSQKFGDVLGIMVPITPLRLVPIQRHRHHIFAKEGGTQSQPLEKFLRLILYYDCSTG